MDLYKPYGAWKVEPNGTYMVTEDDRQTYIEYATPEDVPTLMAEWLGELNRLIETPLGETEAIDAYAELHLGFVHIHPFWDANGRLARLLSNLPMLCAGHLPVVIDVRDRKEYIDILARYEQATGQLTKVTGIWPANASGTAFQAFCRRSYQVTRNLVEQAKFQQAKRKSAD